MQNIVVDTTSITENLYVCFPIEAPVEQEAGLPQAERIIPLGSLPGSGGAGGGQQPSGFCSNVLNV